MGEDDGRELDVLAVALARKLGLVPGEHLGEQLEGDLDRLWADGDRRVVLDPPVHLVKHDIDDVLEDTGPLVGLL